MTLRAMALFASILIFAGSALAGGEGNKKGDRALNFFLQTYNPVKSGHKRVFLDKLVGKKVKEPKKLLLLSFFNIDCKPCRKELPFLEKLHKRYKDAGLQVLVINCDSKANKVEQMIEYVVEEQAFSFPVLKDRFQALQRRYGVGSFPTMYIIDSQGLIVDVRVGYNEETKPFPLADLQKRLGVKQEPLTVKGET